jgi:hypothetical protein
VPHVNRLSFSSDTSVSTALDITTVEFQATKSSPATGISTPSQQPLLATGQGRSSLSRLFPVILACVAQAAAGRLAAVDYLLKFIHARRSDREIRDGHAIVIERQGAIFLFRRLYDRRKNGVRGSRADRWHNASGGDRLENNSM